MSRFRIGLFACGAAVVCWLGMMLVHECGHVLGAWATGGQVDRVVLYFTDFSRTDLLVNPHPLAVVWAGPAFGALFPAAVWGITRCSRRRMVLPQLFAGFCLLANGLYIGVGSFMKIADPKDMLRDGSPVWTLWAFGLLATGTGLWVLHALGPRLGVRADNPDWHAIEVWVAAGLAASLGLVVALS